MAAPRENQGYLIAIIMMVLLIVILAILTYFAFMQAGAASSNLKGKEDLLETANSQLTAYEHQSAMIKGYLGFAPFTVGEVETHRKAINDSGVTKVITETDGIVSQYEGDMARYIRPTGEGVEKTYRGLTDDMGIALMDGHRRRVTLNATVEVAEEDKKEAIAKKDEEIKLVEGNLDIARKALAAEQTLHNQTKASLNTQLAAAKESNRKINEQHELARTTWNNLQVDLTTARDTAESTVSVLSKRLAKYESNRFDVADGKVINIAPEFDRVYVDLGSADRLQRRQSFSIFDQDSDTFERGREKAKIEITNITGPHTAEARIVESSNVNPILSGDFVLTPTWDRGFSVPVALAGFFDLNGDNRSDLDRVIGLIRENGGTVVAYNDDNGQVQGKVTEDTRFIVLGEEPLKIDHIQASSKIEQQAKDFVVQRVPFREYLNSMGVRIESKIEQGTGTLRRGTRFPNRKPPQRTGDGAFGDN